MEWTGCYPPELSQTYCKISNIRPNKSQNLNDSRLVLQLSLPNPFNYFWVINNLIAYKGMSYIRDGSLFHFTNIDACEVILESLWWLLMNWHQFDASACKQQMLNNMVMVQTHELQRIHLVTHLSASLDKD